MSIGGLLDRSEDAELIVILDEPAPAKINLTLAVRGKRPDGYHELDSLVAFASFGDHLRLTTGTKLAVTATGDFATAIVDENLIHKTVRKALEIEPRLVVGTFGLDKRLPVAAGLGGGSSDAAAALRLLQRVNPTLSDSIDWHAIAASSSADVPVCLLARAARMQGLGEIVTPLPHFPSIGCVLANPRLPLATAAVFRALKAPSLEQDDSQSNAMHFVSATELLDFVRSGHNDLEAPAIALCPAIADVRRELALLPGARIARMSGSGPTCFALFTSKEEAEAGARALAARHPHWWSAAGTLS